MFAEPTIDDFIDRLRRELATSTAALNRAIGEIVTDHASRGILVSSATVQRVWEDTLKIHTEGVQRGFDTLVHAIGTMKLDRTLLRDTAVGELEIFNKTVQGIAEGKTRLTPAMKQFNLEESKKIGENFQYLLRQFDVGLTPAGGISPAVLKAATPDGPAVPFERRHDVLISAKRAAVFDYVTNPKSWPQWIASSHELDCEDRPQRLGDVFREYWSTQKGPVTLDWLVIACDRPGLWIGITGTSFTGPIVVQYDFAETPSGTVFTRIVRNPRRPKAPTAEMIQRIDEEAEQGLARIKTNLEKR